MKTARPAGAIDRETVENITSHDRTHAQGAMRAVHGTAGTSSGHGLSSDFKSVRESADTGLDLRSRIVRRRDLINMFPDAGIHDAAMQRPDIFPRRTIAARRISSRIGSSGMLRRCSRYLLFRPAPARPENMKMRIQA